MNLNDLFRKLSYGELSNLSMSEENPGVIRESNQPNIVNYLNDVLRSLHTRFQLRERAYIIELQEGRVNYPMVPGNSVQNALVSGEMFPFIVDGLDQPMIEPVIRILTVTNECGIRLPLNEEGNPRSLFTKHENTLVVPYPIGGNTLSTTCQVYPLEVLLSQPERTIDVPIILEGALLAGIAGRVFSSINTPEASAKAQEHVANYLAICQEIEEKDNLSLSSTIANNRFQARGWV